MAPISIHYSGTLQRIYSHITPTPNREKGNHIFQKTNLLIPLHHHGVLFRPHIIDRVNVVNINLHNVIETMTALAEDIVPALASVMYHHGT